LRQAGHAPPVAAAAPEPAGPVLGTVVEAWVSSVDGRGDRLVWLVRDRARSDALLVAADVNEPGGLRDLRVLDVTRKQLRLMRQRFQREGGITLVPADWRAVDALVVEAEERAASPERRLDYRRIRSRLTSAAPRPAAELRSSRVAPPTQEERDRLVADSTALLAEPELRTWWPRPEAAEPFLADIRDIRESPLVLPPAQQEERLRAVLARAVDALYPPAVFARRLDAVAYVMAESGRPDAARRALAVADALRAAPHVEVPLFLALVHRGLGMHLAAAEAERRDVRADALVRTPSELATTRSPSRPPRPPG
jgi:hypothetical protein